MRQPEVRRGDVYTDAAVRRWPEMPCVLTDWMIDGSGPPDGLSLWIYRRDELAPGDDEQRIWLVTVTADGVTTRFDSSSFGMAGLVDVDVVWHPGWPIEHPLVKDGGAQQVWPPSDMALDIVKLPGVHPREFGFLKRAKVHLADGVLGSGRLPPLTPTLDVSNLITSGLVVGGAFVTD